MEFFPVGDGLVLTASKDGQATMFLRMEVADLLQSCREFKTLNEHIESYCLRRQASVAMRSAMYRELQKLSQSGCLTSYHNVITSLQKPMQKSLPTPITCIGFPTSERVDALERALLSYIENCQHFGRTCDFAVMDDSAHLETREAYRKMLRRLQSHTGRNIAYAGLEEKIAFAKRLSETSGLPLEVVAFAITGDKEYGITTVGANRNALLLHTVGECIFSADDDTLCQVAAVPGTRERGLLFSSQGSPVEGWFFPDRQSLLQAAHFIEQDFLANHEQWLGREPLEAAASNSQKYEIECSLVGPSFLRDLEASQGKVLLTINGAIGDCRWDNPQHYLFLRGDTFKRITPTEQEYRSASVTREVLQAVQQVTVTRNSGSLFATYLGLDNREFLPPFPPLGRAEDVGFGMTLDVCFKAAYTVHLPWALYHSPLEKREYSTQSMFGIGFNTWLASCISLFDPGFAHSPLERLGKLGGHLKELGGLSKSSFEEFVRLRLWLSISSMISELEERMRNNNEPLPSYWVQDAKSHIAQARKTALVPLVDLYVLDGGTELLQRLLIRFGQMLECWPVMLETARRLRMEGCRLALPL